MKVKSIIITLFILFLFYGCRKGDNPALIGTRLQKIIFTEVADSLNNQICNTCYTYILFQYDANNRLISLVDSSISNRILYVQDTNVIRVDKKYTFQFNYDAAGRLVKINTFPSPYPFAVDSFVNNTRNLPAIRYTYEPRVKGFLVRDIYKYDAEDRLVLDSFQDSPGISQWLSKAAVYSNNNCIDEKWQYDVSGVMYSLRELSSTFDKTTNPLKDFGFLSYFFGWGNMGGFFENQSANNLLQMSIDFITNNSTSRIYEKFEYTYYSNGMLKTKTRVGSNLLLRFIYE